jgi:hypothetical protein
MVSPTPPFEQSSLSEIPFGTFSENRIIIPPGGEFAWQNIDLQREEPRFPSVEANALVRDSPPSLGGSFDTGNVMLQIPPTYEEGPTEGGELAETPPFLGGLLEQNPAVLPLPEKNAAGKLVKGKGEEENWWGKRHGGSERSESTNPVYMGAVPGRIGG